ncbi:hypothetical protein BV20DRAFT_367765 [Pilatotrama ljubarskyi]|nr:hypothetical protein BV20DRAFT_367765 [Pilatotrama ljubarskyi]
MAAAGMFALGRRSWGSLEQLQGHVSPLSSYLIQTVVLVSLLFRSRPANVLSLYLTHTHALRRDNSPCTFALGKDRVTFRGGLHVANRANDTAFTALRRPRYTHM